MGLEPGHYLGWYNAEITRYRDTEWKVSGYAGAFSLGLIYFATDPQRRLLLAPYGYFVVPLLLMWTSFLLWSEAHVHSSLNLWRKRRDALRRGEADHFSAKASLIDSAGDGALNRVDFTYFAAFESFIAASALFAIGVLFPSQLAVSAVFIVVFFAWVCASQGRSRTPSTARRDGV